jgi:hypothetical protein
MRGGTPRLPRDEAARRLRWLVATVREEVPDLPVEAATGAGLRVSFATLGQAAQFHRALLAENMDAGLDGHAIELRVAPWYTTADVESVALAVAKVAHYLGI